MKKKIEKEKTIPETLEELKSATGEYQICYEVEQEARAKTAEALKRLNAAQKLWEVKINGLKAKAPEGTVWSQSTNPNPPAARTPTQPPRNPAKKRAPASSEPNPWATTTSHPSTS